MASRKHLAQLVTLYAFASLFMNLNFEQHKIPYWAARYQYPGEELIVLEIAPRIKEQGFLTAVDLTILCEWKSPRIRSRCAANDPDFVEVVSHTALSTPNERLRIESLTLLSGVA